jgi:hypothetical protein
MKPRCKNCEFLIDDPKESGYRCEISGNELTETTSGFCDMWKEMEIDEN